MQAYLCNAALWEVFLYYFLHKNSSAKANMMGMNHPMKLSSSYTTTSIALQPNTKKKNH